MPQPLRMPAAWFILPTPFPVRTKSSSKSGVAAFWARRFGAAQVAVTASSNRREALAFGLGATAFVTPSDNFGEALTKAPGGPADVVCEAVDLVRPRGTVVVLGLCTVADTYNPFQTKLKEVRIHPSMLYDLSEFEALRHRTIQCKTLVDVCGA